MIFDSIENHTLYPYGDLWNKAFEFINTLAPEVEEGRQILQGDDLFAGIDLYETKPRADAKLETHQKYVDIQLLLSGKERLEIFKKPGLMVSEPYNVDKDAEFYQVPDEPITTVTLQPGEFIVFFPEDAHMPCLIAEETPQSVKKVVIKVRADLLI